MKKSILLCFFLLLILSRVSLAQSDEDLDVVSGWLHYSDVENSMYHHLAGQAFDYLEKRALRVRSIKTEGQWRQYQEELRERLLEIVGPFPEKTPLNARTLGTLERPEFTVENIVYESLPGFYVTAAVYVPRQMDGRVPAIIYASGHTADGYRAEAYQRKIMNLVKKGFLVLAFDPLGQGERLQYVDGETGESRVGGPTSEHSYVGAQAFLTGSSLARYMIWDGIRTVDYLLTRSDVDPERIGITGRSGGGTQSSYIAAFDDRIYASAPENYITSFEYLLKSIAPQDAEQNFYHGISTGIDHADLLLARAPKPNLVIATTRDFFSIQGVGETYAEVERCYQVLGKPDLIAYAEDDHGHGSTQDNREAMYAFFQKHLDNPGSSDDLEVEFFSSEELQVTETGQVLTSLGGESVFSLHAGASESLVTQLIEKRSDPGSHIQHVKEQAPVLAGYRQPVQFRPEVFTGRYIRDGYAVEKYFIRGEGEYPVPYLMFRPEDANQELIVYLNPHGKADEADPDGEIEWLVKQGFTVVAPDLLGTGEMGPGLPRGDSYIGNVSYNQFFAAVQIGRSITGVRAGDINRLIHTVTSKNDVLADQLILFAKGWATPDALHAAAFNDLISDVVLIEPLISYQSVMQNEFYHSGWVHSLVAGAFTTYDLPDLGALIAPRRLLYVNMADEKSEPLPAGSDRIESKYAGAKAAFEWHDAPDQLAIETTDGEDGTRELVEQWLRNGVETGNRRR